MELDSEILILSSSNIWLHKEQVIPVVVQGLSSYLVLNFLF